MTRWVFTVWIKDPGRSIASAKVVEDGDTMVTPLDKVIPYIGWKCFDKGARQWDIFDLGRSQDVKLSHGGSQPWVERGSMKGFRWKSARLRSVVDTGKTSSYIVGGGFGSDLSTLLDC